ncbi:hypothetical protein KCP78_20995 [Salmonella enterica subsp. enterica]|nr:hypothetical protein KCP78_20995 [Salmonella enterica subsp. enterica]
MDVIELRISGGKNLGVSLLLLLGCSCWAADAERAEIRHVILKLLRRFALKLLAVIKSRRRNWHSGSERHKTR